VPGVEGPRWIASDRWPVVHSQGAGGPLGIDSRVQYDDDLRRYVLTEFRVFRLEARGRVTSEVLRQVAVSDLLWPMLHSDSVIRELPNPDNVEPWGATPPEGLSKEGPSDRALRWVAHLYLYGMAVALNPAVEVEERLGLSHSTAARWIRLARQKGYLGPSEGPGRAAG
jgi:hypothetical protein